MNRTRFLALLLLLLATVLLASPARAWPVCTRLVLEVTQCPTPTMKVCHICGDDVVGGSAMPEPTSTVAPDKLTSVVRVIMFWMDGCPHCHEVLDNGLPSIQEKYGEKLEIKLIELVGGEEVTALYQLAESRGISKEKVEVPFLVIGEYTLIGAEKIPAELPGLIDSYLAFGGVDWPKIPELEAVSQKTTPSPAAIPNEPTSGAIVEAVLFNTPDCHDCQVVIAQAITPARERYGDLFQLETVNIVTSEDVEYLYQTAAAYGLQKEQVDLPLLIIGDSVLVGEKIVSDLPNLIEQNLSAGGVAYPQSLERPGTQTPEVKPSPITTPSPMQTVSPTEPTADASSTNRIPNGYLLAVLVMFMMVVVLAYTGFIFIRLVSGHSPSNPFGLQRLEWLIPILALLGIGASGYLAYVETQAVPAVCGPVGDCNAVQSSPYASLFGLLPVGVLGLIGYILILAAWYIQRSPFVNLAAWAGLALFVIAFGGTLFSLYLTYLEPFVIHAVCVWCLTSAVIITLILMLSLGPANRHFNNWRTN